MIVRATWQPWLGLLALWTGAFVTACFLLHQPLLQSGQQLSAWANLLSAGRAEMSRSLYGRAEVYFHRGVEDRERQAFPGYFGQWLQAVAPTEHRHAEDAEGLETMPWLRWATEMDPQNMDAWLDAAYAAAYANNPALSLKILAAAARHNPRDERLYAQRGLLLLHQRSFAQATRDFDRALQLAAERKTEAAVLTQAELIAILKNKTLCAEMLGQRETAMEQLRRCVALEPARVVTREWLATLAAGGDLRTDAEQRLRGMETAARHADPDERHEESKP